MRFALIILLNLILTGCVTSPVYNPMQAASLPEISLNQDGLKALQDGMTVDEVHKIMGQELVIGYEAQAPAAGYKHLTVPNPYKSEAIKDYIIEYYIEAVRHPDGIVSDDELMPLVFENGKLIGRGWPLANTIRPAQSSA
jgi:hypothetical protein